MSTMSVCVLTRGKRLAIYEAIAATERINGHIMRTLIKLFRYLVLKSILVPIGEILKVSRSFSLLLRRCF